MRIAMVADLHGNYPAVEAIERHIRTQNVDEIFCLGDLVGKGPSSDRTFDWAMANCSVILKGNWDDGVSERLFAFDAPYYAQLGERRMRALRELPLEHVFFLGGLHIRLIHGRPVMPTLYRIFDERDTLLTLYNRPEGGRYDAVGYADSHNQGMRWLRDRLLFNTGSVGNSIGLTHAFYLVAQGGTEPDGEPLSLQFFHLPYDRAQAVRDAEAAPFIPRIDTYINEIKTGVYSR
mgnify:CR=1 FL=1